MHTSVILALFLDSRQTRRLARLGRRLPRPTEAGGCHITLAYLGDLATLQGHRQAITRALVRVVRADNTAIVRLPIGPAMRMPKVDDDGFQAVAATVAGDGIRSFRADLVDALKAEGVPIDERFPTYIPHVTLGYLPASMPTPPIRVPRLTILADEITLCWGDETVIVPMMGDTVKAIESYTPPESARNNARQALAWRRTYGYGGTAVGVARARDLANGKGLSRSTIGRMRNFFARHGQYRATKHAFIDGKPTPWRVAWDLWGGDSARSWVEGLSLSTKPFQSTAQQRWAFASDQPFAEAWADETDFAKLPAKVKAGERIAGQLCRDKKGMYVNCDSPQATAESKNKLKKEEREQQKKEERSANSAKVAEGAGLGANLHDALLEFASPDEAITLAPQNAEKLMAAGLVEQNPDGTYRISGAGRSYVAAAAAGDVGRARDAMGRGAERVARRQEREAKRAEREAKRNAPKPKPAAAEALEQGKPKKGGGGGGGGGGAPEPKKAPKPKVKPARAIAQAPKRQTPRERLDLRRADRLLRDADRLIKAQKVKRTHPFWKAYRQERKAGKPPSDARRAGREAAIRRRLDRVQRQQGRLLTRLTM